MPSGGSKSDMRAVSFVLPLLAPALLLGQPQGAWVDPSPHAVRMLGVEPGTSIEVLDWGGSGRPLVLLAQLGQTAHIYDDWAPRLARSYRVLGVTRRGYGASTTTPEAGMSTERLASDIEAALAALEVRRAVLVGHAFAGEEMSWIGSHHADRIAGLVYVDAAYDRRNVAEEAAIMRRIPNAGGVPMRPQDMESAAALARWMSANIGFPIPESEVRQIARFGPDGRAMGERISPDTPRRALAAMAPVDYATIRAPALALYAKRGPADVAPGCRNPTDEPVRQACRELFDWTSRQLAQSQALVKTIDARTDIVDLPGTNAFVFLAYEREITRAIDRFVATLAR